MTKARKERFPVCQSTYYTLKALQAVFRLLPFPITITSPCCSLSLIKYNPVGVFQHQLDPWPRADFTLLRQSQRFCASVPFPYSHLIFITFITVWIEALPSERSNNTEEPAGLGHPLSEDNQCEGCKITWFTALLSTLKKNTGISQLFYERCLQSDSETMIWKSVLFSNTMLLQIFSKNDVQLYR